MLVLTRKMGEAVIIADNIEITVLEVKGEQIKLGIQAPKDVDIHRKELYVSIQNANKQALNDIKQLDDFLNVNVKKD